MGKIPLLTTGANGLVGSKFVELFQEKYEITSLELRHASNPVDITHLSSVLTAFENSPAQVVIHLAAYTDVTGAWKQDGDKNGSAYQVNVIGTQNIVTACHQFNKFLIHVSTAYVFDGESAGLYSETDFTNPIEWYGQTKLMAEELIQASQTKHAILRIDQPFRSDGFEKTDIAHRIIQGLKTSSLQPMFDNHFFGPTFIDDFAKVLDFFVEKQVDGLFHASAGEKWSDYEFAQAIKKIHNLSTEVKPGNLEGYLKTVNRPYQKNTALNCEKLIKILPFQMNTIEKALSLIKIE